MWATARTLFLLISILAVAGGSYGDALCGEKVLNIRLLGEPETLDWNKAHTPYESYLLTSLMEGLVSLDLNLKVTPALAQSWTINQAGNVYLFHLRPGVKWSDGVPLKAQDFVFSWQRLLSSSLAAANAYFLFDIKGAEDFYQGRIHDFGKVGVKALNESTLQVVLTHPVAHWIQLLAYWPTFPMRADITRQFQDVSPHPIPWVTLGPYLMSEHTLESKFVMKRNPLYYGGPSHLDRIVGWIIRDDATALNLYETGTLDFLTDLSTLDLQRLQNRPDLKTFPYLKTGYLGFLTQTRPTSNVHVRRAIGMAIDKSQIGGLLLGGQIPATSLIPPGILGYSKNLGLKFDPTEARRELKSSGVSPNEPIQLELTTLNGDKALLLTQYLQGELKKNLGIDLVIQPYDNKTFRAKLKANIYPGYLLSWSADYPDPDNFLSVFLSYSPNNHTNWRNESFDREVIMARQSLKLQARESSYFNLQKTLLQDEAPIVPLYYESILALVRPRVLNLELNPLNYLNLKKVTLVD